MPSNAQSPAASRTIIDSRWPRASMPASSSNNAGIDITVQLLDAGGRVAAEFDSESRKQGRELVGLVADTPVRYEVRVTPKYPKEAAASYEIRLAEVRPATEGDRFLFEAHKLGVQALTLDQAGKYDEATSVAQRALSLSEKVPGRGRCLHRIPAHQAGLSEAPYGRLCRVRGASTCAPLR